MNTGAVTDWHAKLMIMELLLCFKARASPTFECFVKRYLKYLGLIVKVIHLNCSFDAKNSWLLSIAVVCNAVS